MRIHPSILSADFGYFAAELESIASADAAHVDVMDNHFVPNLTFGLPVVKRLQELSPIPLDVHLMIEKVDVEGPKYAELGVESVTFHLEASEQPHKLAKAIRAAGASPAVAIKPATPVESALDLLSEVDMLLVMTVEPGFGGQLLLEETLSKIAEARSAIESSGKRIMLQIDGGVTELNVRKLASLGADSIVAGSAVFSAADRKERIAQLRSEALQGYNSR